MFEFPNFVYFFNHLPMSNLDTDGSVINQATQLFGIDVQPMSSLCSTPNRDYRDPDITHEENL